MNVSISMLLKSSKCTAQDKLHAKIARYAFLSFFWVLLYLIGPVKSVPITSKAVPPFVRSCGSLPGTGLANDVARNRLQLWHFFRTDLTELCSLGTQYFSRIAVIVKPTPPWSVSQCILSTNFSVNVAFLGRYTGC